MVYDIPASRDPFGNAQLIPAGIDEKSGQERFWFTTWNSCSGCTGVLVSGDGTSRSYRFDVERGEYGFYSAQYVGDDILWLCGFLDEVVCLDLKSGEKVHYKTGLPHALVSSGMCFDAESGKLFMSTYCQDDMKRKAFVFDIKARKVVKTINDVPVHTNQMRFSMQLPDGRFLCVYCVPNLELFCWNPKDDSMDVLLNVPVENILTVLKFVARDDGTVYVPYHGWFDPVKQCFVDQTTAPCEATWFAVRNNSVYGLEGTPGGNAILREWDFKTGRQRPIYEIPDGNVNSCQLMQNGKMVSVNRYGYFSVIDSIHATIGTSRKLDTDAVGYIDCLYRIDEDTLLATPFITQRFLQIDLKTGKGCDMGRANNGGGEILQVIGFKDKIYMAAYTEGQLAEYDPKLSLRFPENPLVVAMPGHDALRPVSMCRSENDIYYSCSREYGHNGGVLVRFHPESGEHQVSVNALGERVARSLHWNEKHACLIAGSTYEADCRSCLPSEDTCILAKLDAQTMQVTAKVGAPSKTALAHVIGAVDCDHYLVTCLNEKALNPTLEVEGEAQTSLYLLDVCSMTIRKINKPLKHFSCTHKTIYSAGTMGEFIVVNGDDFSLWRYESDVWTHQSDICSVKNHYNVHIQDYHLYVIAKKRIYIYPFINN